MATRLQEAMNEQISEAELQDWVLAYADVCGWRPYHTHDSRRSHKGLPDLILVRRGRLIFAELKREKGRTSPEQRAWLADLHEVAAAVRAASTDDTSAVEVYGWRPSDRNDIERILA